MEEHKKRIIKAIKYIDSNLDADLSLEKIAEIATYSSFHFHRIFKLTTGETLQNYIIRKKIEKSALYLAVKKEIQLKDIYLDLGFSNHSVFSKTFKKYYGIAPSSFRNSAPETFHKILQIQSKNGQVDTVFSQYICTIENLLNWTKMNLKIEIKQLPEMDLAAVMSLGIANVEPSYNTLIEWAKKKQLFPRENVKMISVYHDSFKVTPPDKVRIHAGMLLDEKLEKQEGLVFSETIDAGKFIVGSGEVTLQDFEQCWVSLFLWMNEHHYTMRKAFPFEIYHSNFKEHPEGKMAVDFCIPVH
ncbi:AraC family transcriptional regulator [Chryseobacterium lathyri]|jgi:AraC family transcriptional regulator|uniref:AraC family transcriptional regulator n=1 Tax=Chryseobacterium lathyri TaxID=395933 RepID=A0A511Y9Q4_9FLAO|nr:GyrI-like domain-containing protein [Chryseobacterium lathyri]GEN71924.1 AraC family transcriptional regulator [Chryseobacterium lathyri]